MPIYCTDTLYAADSLPDIQRMLEYATEQHPKVVARKAALTQRTEQLRVTKSESWPTLSVGFWANMSRIRVTAD